MRVLGVIQCRMVSTRLPGKALAEIAGQPALTWVIERVRRCRRLDGALIATTTDPTDDPVADLAGRCGLDVVRGASEDVLSRYVAALDRLPAERVVRITADNPLTAPESVDALVDFALAEDADYAYVARYPYGGSTDLFRADLLRAVHRADANIRQREHINAYFLDHYLGFHIASLRMPPELERPDVRLTLDDDVDLARLRALFARLRDPATAAMDEVIRAYDALPESSRARYDIVRAR